MSLILFIGTLLITAGASVMVVVSRRPLYSALWLIVSLISTAAVYVFMRAHFLAAAQVILYAGAIMVLFIFVIMLVHFESTGSSLTRYWEPILVAGVALLGTVTASLLVSNFITLPVPDRFGSVAEFAGSLLSQNVWLFELTSVLLLVAIIGVVVVARFQRGIREIERKPVEKGHGEMPQETLK